MSSPKRALSGYKAVWLFALFDLPVDSEENRRQYVRFRKRLLEYGFSMLQYSVYARYFSSEEASETYRQRLKAMIPPQGQVRLLSITDRQFGKMEVFEGKIRQVVEKPPTQLLLF